MNKTEELKMQLDELRGQYKQMQVDGKIDEGAEQLFQSTLLLGNMSISLFSEDEGAQ